MDLKVSCYLCYNVTLEIKNKGLLALNGQNSDWRKINSDVPQRSVLDSLLFLIYVNDLPNRIMSICKIFADDTSLFLRLQHSY